MGDLHGAPQLMDGRRQGFQVFGYSVVAINHVVEFKEKKQEIEKPVAISELFTTLPIVQVGILLFKNHNTYSNMPNFM